MADQHDNHVIEKFFIGGEWVRPASQETIVVTESSTGEELGRVPSAGKADVARAVEAAWSAAAEWGETPPGERAAKLAALGDRLEARVEELARLEAREIGTPLEESRLGQVLQASEFLQELPTAVERLNWEEPARSARAVRSPVGVVGAITAWNFPLQIIAAKAGAALTAGCPVVVKSSEVAPLSSFAFAEEAANVGLPPGTLNVLTGYGPDAGQALVEHPGVSKVSFTGSVSTARQIALAAAPQLKPLALELGGKSASVVLDDADLEAAIRGSLSNAFQGSGQVCCATTRVLVPRDRLSSAEEIAAEAIAADWPVGAPLESGTKIGPLVSAPQQERVLGYIEAGIADGARLVAGGAGRPEDLDRGYFVRPTVFTSDNTTRVAREEIFGPVVTLIPYDGSEEDAAAIANDSEYGLGGAVWSADSKRASAFALRLRTGQVEINGAPWDPTAPFGGFGLSGYGRENGHWGVEEFTTWKALHL